ncbi:MAG: winged helix-turn-helix domain-containing protein [Acidobacteriaceae bacterium]
MRGRVYKFAGFELAAGDGELRTGATSVRLQEKPLLLLCALLDRPQTLVTRQQLREHMWNTKTFVDYEQGINVAVKKVRDALGDSAERPRFVQTIAKKGYRFLVPVEVLESPSVIRPSQEPEASGADSRRGSPPVARLLWASVALTLVAAGLWYLKSAIIPHQGAPIHSIAVLPLRNLSPDPGQGYFADGVTEDLITNLAQSLPLRVISRTSVMRFRDSADPVQHIARALGVDAVVEGAVARSGRRVTVTVRLIDARHDRHLWARRYDREAEDLPDIEAEVSREISNQIGSQLPAQHIVNRAKIRSVDPEVYELCMLGRWHWNRRTANDLEKSAEYYRQAVGRDPNYAPAYAGLANAYALMPVYDSVAVQETYAKATAAAKQALALDDTMAEAHAALGIIALNAIAWKPAGPELRRALDLNPNYATAYHWYAFYLLFSGRTAEALAEIEMARQLDPLSAIINADEGVFLYSANRLGEARIRLRQAIELQPDFDQPHETLALIDLESGDPSTAWKEARTGLALGSTNPRTIGEAGYVSAATGHSEEARKLLSELREMARHGADEPLFEALVDLGLKNRGQAVSALERDARLFGIVGLSQWHAFSQLEGDQRYQALIGGTTEMAAMKPGIRGFRSGSEQ